MKTPARLLYCFLLIGWFGSSPAPAANWTILSSAKESDSIAIAGKRGGAVIAVDAEDHPVVQIAANLLADDIHRVSGLRPVVTNTASGSSQMIIAGTLGHSRLIDALIRAGKLKDVDAIRNRWEATLSQIVPRPLPGVEKALVIVGSDRRGTAYGLTHLSESIGVSPWYWWADVPVPQRRTLAVKLSAPQVNSPAVKYRGIFINDEDWGLFPWAAETFDPKFGNIGPKTYEKVFELMLRLRLNYIWPAMHECSLEFGSVPENVALADRFAIVAGASHCEPMLCNNIHWNEQEKGRWNYSLNRGTIHSYWEENAKARGAAEAVWTLGIRGIHDQGMQTPPTALPDKLALMREVLRDQRALLDRHVTRKWGSIAQCFVPYKEVLPIYDAGLEIPEDVTLVWVDDNFGYIRRLSAPEERKRPGGAGVYWHLSYYGGPHSYTWINTTAPALIWEEFHKAWQNEARTLWVLNVGDIKPMEIGMDYFARLAWNPEGFELGAQRKFLHEFSTRAFGKAQASRVTELLMEYYRLGTVRKPELMNRAWALSLAPAFAAQLEQDYANLLKRETALRRQISAEARDAYIEMVGFPSRVVGSAGLIFLADRKAQQGTDAKSCADEIANLRNDLEIQVQQFNTTLAGGKWNRMMPGLVTATNLTQWNSQVRWPWGERPASPGSGQKAPNPTTPERSWRDAASANRQVSPDAARWCVIEGLGQTGRALALQPAKIEHSWSKDDTHAPTLEYDFKSAGGEAEALFDFLPTFRIHPGMKLRVAVAVDDQPATIVEVPGSSGNENETGPIRTSAVQNNYARARLPLANLKAGKHVLKIRAMDPGVVLDRLSLP